MDALIIEVLDRFGKVKTRHRVESFPCKIGRDFSNNIILDDTYISPNHITIEQSENSFLLQDNESMNGVYNVHPFKKLDSLAIENNSRIRIGHTDIRFNFTDHNVKETLKDRDVPSQLAMLVSNVFVLPIVWFIFCAAFMIDSFIEETGLITFQKLLSETLPLLIFIIIWALIWATISKVVTHRFYFIFHAIWVSCLTIASTILDNFSKYFEFSFSISGSAYIISLISSIVITSLLFYGHLHYSTTLTAIKSKYISITTSIVIIGMIEIFSLLNATEFSNTPRYSSVIKPPMFILAPASTIDDFFAGTTNIKDNIDEELQNTTSSLINKAINN